MQIILAVEPDRRQAAQLAAIVRHRVGAELVLAATTERALDVLGARVPDLVLVPALLSPQDDAALAAALRVIAAAAHVRTLTIPVLGNSSSETSRGGLLSRWRRGRAESPAPDGCDPAVFAEQITAYLKEAAAERAERADHPPSRVAAIADLAQPEREARDAVQATNAFEAPPSAFDTFAGAEEFAAETFAAETFAPAQTFAPAETFARAETFSAAERYAGAETFARAETFTAAERYAGAETHATTESYEAPLSTIAQDEQVDAESPMLDLSSELVDLAPPANDQSLFAGEPFGTYTLPAFDDVQAEATASLEAPLPIETSPAFEAPMVAESHVESPIDVDEPIMLEEPLVFDEPIVLAEPVFFEPSAIFEQPMALEAGSESPVVFEPPDVLEPAAALHVPALEAALAPASPVEIKSPVVASSAAAVKAPVVFERPEVVELMAPVGMTPWRAWPPIEGVPIEVAAIAAVVKADVPDWSELMASLRQDMERRRKQEHQPPTAARKPRSKSAKPAVDEWGFFDPEQCGFSALLAKLDEITTA
jgi:hypothetical protein